MTVGHLHNPRPVDTCVSTADRLPRTEYRNVQYVMYLYCMEYLVYSIIATGVLSVTRDGAIGLLYSV